MKFTIYKKTADSYRVVAICNGWEQAVKAHRVYNIFPHVAGIKDHEDEIKGQIIKDVRGSYSPCI